MREAVAERDRWLALGLLLLALLIGYLVLVHPWWTQPMQALNARIASLQQRDLRARMALEQAPLIRKQLAALQAQTSRVPGFMPERSPELATSALVQRLETAVLEASPGNRSCQISNRSPVSEPRQGRFPRVAVQVQLRCGTPELAVVLHSLERGSPRLFVDNLNLLVQRYYTGTNQPQNSGLQVSFDLYGYLQPEPREADDARR